MLKQISRLAMGGAAMALATAAALVGTTSIASATSCAGDNVATGTVCTDGDLTFTFTSVTYAPSSAGDALTIFNATPGRDATLLFQLDKGTNTNAQDVLLDYTVTSTSSNISGIDAELPAGNTGNIDETACSKAFSGITCTGTVLSTINDSTSNVNVNGTPGSFGPLSTIYIDKDVHLITGSEFADSVVETPEPVTLSLFGAGLAGLGYGAVRRRNKAKA